MTRAFEVGARARLRALHRVPWAQADERELHAHEYAVQIVVERDELDDRGVVCDLDVLKRALAAVLGQLEGRDLDAVVDKGELEAVTVELLARWLHDALRGLVAEAGGQVLAVRVSEADDAFGGYRAAVVNSP